MIWEIGVLILCITLSMALILVAAFLIPALLQIRQSIRRLEETTANLNERLPSILSNVDDISANVSVITTSGRKQAESLRGAVEQIRDVVDDVAGFERNMRRRVESPLLQTVATVAALVRAGRIFLSVMGRERSGRRKKK